MATLKNFTYALQLAGSRDTHTIEVQAYCDQQAATEAYSEACKLGARPGNVARFDQLFAVPA